jgi:hypothetical protein
MNNPQEDSTRKISSNMANDQPFQSRENAEKTDTSFLSKFPDLSAFSKEDLQTRLNSVASRTMAFAIVMTSFGVSRTFIRDNKLALPFYFYGTASTILGGIYFGGVEGMRTLRKQDDFLNYTVPAAIEGFSVVSVTSGLRRGAMGGLVGGLAGTALFFGGNALYSVAREKWIEYRSHLLETSKYRKLVVVIPPHPAAEVIKDVDGKTDHRFFKITFGKLRYYEPPKQQPPAAAPGANVSENSNSKDNFVPPSDRKPQN